MFAKVESNRFLITIILYIHNQMLFLGKYWEIENV